MKILKTISMILTLTLFSFKSFAVQEDGQVDRSTYEATMDKFRTMYPSLSVVADWNEERPQAFANFKRMTVSGGFARKSDISLGGLIAVSCHEVGHALFSLNEGEADFLPPASA